MSREDVECDELLEAIRAASGRHLVHWATPPVRLLGGSWARIYRVRLEGFPGLEGELVARVLPEPESWEREMLIQQHVSKHGFPAPAVHLGAMPTKEFAQAWILMDFDRGGSFVPRRTRAAFVFWIAVMSWRVPRYLARTCAAIHSVDASSMAYTLAMPDTVGPVLNWLYSRAAALSDGVLVDRAQRLLAKRPGFSHSVLCHGDLHPLNILHSPGHDTVIDWTHAQYDDPHYDIAFTSLGLRLLPFPEPPALRPLIEAAGRSLSKRFIRAYERESGTVVDPDRLAWFEGVVALRIYVEAEEARRKGLRADASSSPALVIEPFLRGAGL